MRRTGHRRGWRAVPRLLVTSSLAAAMLGLAASPSQAEPNPVEEEFAEPGGYTVIWDEDNDFQNDDCAFDVAPTADYTSIYPAQLGFPNEHPVIVWANGTHYGSDENPTCIYEPLLERLASWGFVVIAPNDGQTGSGEELRTAANLARLVDGTDGHPFFEKLDTDRIAAAGHSQGAVGAINAALDAPAGRIDSVLALSMPDQEWIDFYNDDATNAACEFFFQVPCEDLVLAPEEVDDLDVPIFFARGTGGHNPGCAVDDLFSNLTHFDWRPDSSVPYAFATVEVDVPDADQTFWCEPPGVPFFPHSPYLYPHVDLRNAIPYAAAWMVYTMTCHADSEDAFTGTPPEISQNSHWDSGHSPILNNLPSCP